jgi:hypothetical protein
MALKLNGCHEGIKGTTEVHVQETDCASANLEDLKRCAMRRFAALSSAALQHYKHARHEAAE